MAKEKQPALGTNALFIFRAFNQNSLQATVETPPNPKPIVVPRTGSAAALGVSSMPNKWNK